MTTPPLSEREAAAVAAVVGLLVLVGLCLDAALLAIVVARRDDERAGRVRPLFAARWSLLDVWWGGQLVVVGTIAAVAGLVFVAAMAEGLAHGAARAPVPRGGLAAGEMPTWVLIASLVPQSAMLVGVPAVFVLAKYGETLASAGLGPPTWRTLRHLLWLVPAIFAVGGLAGVSSEWVVKTVAGADGFRRIDQFSRQVGNQKVLTDALGGPVLAGATVVLAGILVPFAEEVFFRGFLYNAARRRFGVAAAVCISAVIFASVHAGPILVLTIVPVGVLLALAYERTRSLWVPVVMHAAFNTVQLVAALAGLVEV